MSTFDLDIHDKIVAFAECVATFETAVGDQGLRISLSQTLASDADSGSFVHPPPETGAGIVGLVMDACRPC